MCLKKWWRGEKNHKPTIKQKPHPVQNKPNSFTQFALVDLSQSSIREGLRAIVHEALFIHISFA